MGLRLFLSVLSFWLIWAGVLQAQERPLIRMGVRVDARPFAWHDVDNDSYLGFLVDLCADAVTRANYPFVQVPVTAADRVEFFKGNRRDLNLLCDPTTITLARMAEFAALEPPGSLSFSPIVFVANGAYVTNNAADSGELPAPPLGKDKCLSAIPRDQDAPEDEGPPAVAAEADEAEQKTYLAAGYVVGTTIGHTLREAILSGVLELEPGQSVCPVEQLNHVDGLRAFCAGELRFYFGDVDIVRATVAEIRKSIGRPCEFTPAARSLSYEPYALVISGRNEAFRQDFIKALYEVFHHGTANDRFAGHFENFGMSPFLETLFRINRIPAGFSPQTNSESGGGGEGGGGEDGEGEAGEQEE